MNNVAAQGRCEKLYDAVLGNNGAATELLIAEKLNWELSSVRATATQLCNQGKVRIVRAGDHWVLFADDIRIEVPSAFTKSNELDKLATDMVNAITAYVEAIIANRS